MAGAAPRESGLPLPSYRVERPVPLSETQKGLPGPKAIPHGLIKFRSVKAANPGTSATRFVCT